MALSLDQDKGRDLERRIAAFLESHGYEVSSNVVIEGRSGARHELDVVGDKSDGLTSFRLVVECKAWAAPIEKEIVYKLGAILADLGAAKGIVATLSGWTVGAEHAAKQANIELWGPQELSARLGRVALSEMRVRPPAVEAMGFPLIVSLEEATKVIERASAGRFGVFGKEEIAWVGQIWIPAWMLQLAVTRIEGRFKRVPRITRSWSSYEAVSGSWIAQRAQRPPLDKVDISKGHLRPVMTAAKVAGRLTSSFGRWCEVSSDSAKSRHASALARLGVQVPIDNLDIEDSELTYQPVFAAFLRRGAQERIVVVDGSYGEARPGLSEVLTANAQRVRESLGAR
jgi:hypothetical protein